MAAHARRRITLWLWIGQVTVAAAATLYVYFLRISIPHCGDSCDFDRIQMASEVYFWFAAGLAVTCGVLAFLVRRLPLAAVVPGVGIALTVVGALVATAITREAMHF